MIEENIHYLIAGYWKTKNEYKQDQRECVKFNLEWIRDCMHYGDSSIEEILDGSKIPFG